MKRNTSLVMKQLNIAAEILEIPDCQALESGLKKIISGGAVASKDLAKGNRVLVFWPEDGSKIEGKIRRVSEQTSYVRFDDGEEYEIPNALILKTWEEETAK